MAAAVAVADSAEAAAAADSAEEPGLVSEEAEAADSELVEPDTVSEEEAEAAADTVPVESGAADSAEPGAPRAALVVSERRDTARADSAALSGVELAWAVAGWAALLVLAAGEAAPGRVGSAVPAVRNSTAF